MVRKRIIKGRGRFKGIYLVKRKNGYRVYFDNGRLVTENTFGSMKEAKDWLDDLKGDWDFF